MGVRELASRNESGILVRLLWDGTSDRTLIRYRDRRSGDAFVTEVPHRLARQAFRHPNAFRPLPTAL